MNVQRQILINIHHPSPQKPAGTRDAEITRDPNLTKRDENLVPIQVSLKDIWEAFMEKISSFIFSIRGFPFVPI
jgi:hypothetical protein